MWERTPEVRPFGGQVQWRLNAPCCMHVSIENASRKTRRAGQAEKD